MLVILIALNCNLGQCRVTGNRLRFTDSAVRAFKAVFEELFQVDLTAGSGQRQKVHIMDVDIAVNMCFRVGSGKDESSLKRLAPSEP